MSVKVKILKTILRGFLAFLSAILKDLRKSALNPK